MGYAVKLQSAVKDRGIPIVWESKESIVNRSASYRTVGQELNLSKSCTKVWVQGISHEASLTAGASDANSAAFRTAIGSYSAIRNGNILLSGNSEQDIPCPIFRNSQLSCSLSQDGNIVTITRSGAPTSTNFGIYKIYDISKAELIQNITYSSTYATATYSVSVDLSKYRWVIIRFNYTDSNRNLTYAVLLNVPMHDNSAVSVYNNNRGGQNIAAVYVDETGFNVFNKQVSTTCVPKDIYGIK